jgi:predicted SPOUT superfamily RNA methylase MTH1
MHASLCLISRSPLLATVGAESALLCLRNRWKNRLYARTEQKESEIRLSFDWANKTPFIGYDIRKVKNNFCKIRDMSIDDNHVILDKRPFSVEWSGQVLYQIDGDISESLQGNEAV